MPRPSIRSVIWAFRRLCHNVAELLETTGFPELGFQRFDRIERVEIGAANQQRFRLRSVYGPSVFEHVDGGTREIFDVLKRMYSD